MVPPSYATRIEPRFSRESETSAALAHIETRTIAANRCLFRPGDARTHVYRVESGAICLYDAHDTERRSVVEFKFPGDLVGLGFLESHSMTAKAMLETTVTCLDPDAIDEIVQDDPRLQMQFDDAVEREFELRRDQLRTAGESEPLERVAALLVATAHASMDQGGKSDTIRGSLRCGFIADMLRLSLDDLSSMLVELNRRGLIDAVGEELRITDIDGLEALADWNCSSGTLLAIRAQSKRRPEYVSVYSPA
jgi:CRP/FNR family transcriptional regulator, anaerobic regulatory protein